MSDIRFEPIVRILTDTLLDTLQLSANYRRCLLNVAIPDTCVTSVSFPSTWNPSLCISLSIRINNKLLRKLWSLMSFTLTLMLCLHCSYCSSQSFKSTEFRDFLSWIVVLNKWVKTNAVQLLYGCEGRKWRSGTNLLVIILANIRIWGVRFTLRPSYRR